MSNGGRLAQPSIERGLQVILARSTFTGTVSGADEALVRYALHLQRSGHLHSVTLLQRPSEESPFLVRLKSAGITVHCVAKKPSAPAHLLLTVWQLAIRLKLIPHPGAAVAEPRRLAKESLPRRAWHQLWLSLSRRQASRARQYFSASGADLVHVVGSDLGALALIPAARRAGLPVLFHELGGPDHLPQLRLHYTKLGEVLPQCTEVAALSPALANGWRNFYGLPRPVRVLPLIYDDSPLRGRAPSADGSVRIGYAARLEHGKGVMFLLDAFARVRALRPQARLVIAGTGPLEQAARDRAASLDLAGSCEFAGYVPEKEKPRLLSNLDAFVLPTLSEGTPNCVLEAMMFGLPVIASSVGGIPDMLADGAGLLVPAGDVEALAGALARLSDDAALRAQLGRAARQQYERVFRPDVVLEALLHEYGRVAKRRSERDGPLRAHPWVQDDALSRRAPGSSSRAMRGAA